MSETRSTHLPVVTENQVLVVRTMNLGYFSPWAKEDENQENAKPKGLKP